MLNIYSVEGVNILRNMGVKRLCCGMSAVKDIDFLSKAGKIMPIKIILNLACLRNCPNLCMHYSDSQRDENFHRVVCRFIEGREYLVLKNTFTRPEDLHHYHPLNCLYKLATRGSSTRKIEQILKAYIEESYDGNLLDLLECCFSEKVPFINNKVLSEYDFFKKTMGCDMVCDSCGFCPEVFRKATEQGPRLVNPGITTSMNKNDI